MKNILIVTGGSGGHVIPSISIFEHLKDKYNVKIVTDFRGSKFIDKKKFNFDIIDVPNLFTKPYLLPINIFKYIYNIIQSLKFLKKENVNTLISTGGYMTFPFCVAAFLLKKKIILLEPNFVLGRSNKISLKFSDKIICYKDEIKNFPKKYNSKKVVLAPILKKKFYGITKNKINNVNNNYKILIIGGSQGASFFDNKVTDLIIEISKKKKFDILQQISNSDSISLIKKKYDNAKISYSFFEFSTESQKIFNNVDLAITRGGANTLNELSFLGIPFLVIPLPSAKDNHQFHNANYYYEKNCCWLIDQDKFEIEKVSNLIFNIFTNNKDFSEKITNLNKFKKKNNWNNINNNIIEIIDEN